MAVPWRLVHPRLVHCGGPHISSYGDWLLKAISTDYPCNPVMIDPRTFGPPAYRGWTKCHCNVYFSPELWHFSPPNPLFNWGPKVTPWLDNPDGVLSSRTKIPRSQYTGNLFCSQTHCAPPPASVYTLLVNSSLTTVYENVRWWTRFVVL